MIQIETVELLYFRSIYKVRLTRLSGVAILSGRNDVGKSNVLKALNLFFNNQTDWNVPFDFARDFSRQRLAEVRKDTIKGKQFIQVKIGFVRGDRYSGSLPASFTVTRTWFRDSANAVETSSLPRQFKAKKIRTATLARAQAGLQRYLNTIRFEYLPAIKDQTFFAYMLGRLQDLVFEKGAEESDIAAAVRQLNQNVERESGDLRKEFERVSGVATSIGLPERMDELFRAFAVATALGDDSIPLGARGDGLRSRFLPSLLHHLSQNARAFYIWGFEEPENSLEHRFATALASDMVTVYSQKAQILVTSHSPAFFGRRDDGVSVYRVFRAGSGTEVHRLYPEPTHPASTSEILAHEMGLMEFEEQCQREYALRLEALVEAQRAVEMLANEMRSATSPVLLTEGKFDKAILEEAWRRRRGTAVPFRILSCDPAGVDGGGASQVKLALEASAEYHPPLVGLFDRDREGLANFSKLSDRFKSTNDPNIKINLLAKAAAMVLPAVPGREKYAEAQNLPIEFYFSDGVLGTSVDGRRLKLVPGEIEERLVLTGQTLRKREASEPHFQRIVSATKQGFADKVVPSLPAIEFANFDGLFERIENAIVQMRAQESVPARRKKK